MIEVFSDIEKTKWFLDNREIKTINDKSYNLKYDLKSNNFELKVQNIGDNSESDFINISVITRSLFNIEKKDNILLPPLNLNEKIGKDDYMKIFAMVKNVVSLKKKDLNLLMKLLKK